MFINVTESVHLDPRGIHGGPQNPEQLAFKLGEVPHTSPIWAAKYPKLATILNGNPHEPVGNVITQNIHTGSGRFENYIPKGIIDPYVDSTRIHKSPYSDSDYVNATELNFALAPNHPAFAEIDFKQLETDKMGLAGPVGPRVSEGIYC